MIKYIFVCLIAGVLAGDESSVKLSLGKIRGYYKKSFNGRLYRAFEGVPYARPPVGELRFREPQPAGPWPGVLTARRTEGGCLEYQHLLGSADDQVQGTEDCLYLNIYAPVDVEELLPVIFYIHGGAFQFGSGNVHSPHYLMDRDVVYVNVNYRLGPFGFLSTEDNVVPGNMGLKDQSLALKWVKNHIEAFGGDPNRITLAGMSAGGTSVHYHYLSPMSRGLFHAGMSFSGTALNCWSQTENSLEKSKKLSDILGCPTTNTTVMIECLRTRPGKSISQATGQFQPWLYSPYTPFGPVVERQSANPFIDRPPAEIIASGGAADVPWMTTLTSEEGLYPAAEFVDSEELMEELDKNWDKILPHLLDYNYTIPASRHGEVSRKIRSHYLGRKKLNKVSVLPLIHMVGDRLFAIGGEKAARMMAKANKSPVLFYLYSYRAPDSLSDLFIPSKPDLGVSHADDVFLVLRYSNAPEVTDETAIAMQRILMDIWVSFAADKTTDKQIQWDKVDPASKSLNYLHIYSPSDIQMEMHSNMADKYFWKTINFNENVIYDQTNSRDEL
ncbi:venom carboxylesterase-6-like [Microplitis mediator]|uniref:venom carboxylesterase-6-like n=1 Tax=Microplitis mediator TaxID=375433 RepID=UPI002554BEBA|nr:venom carboxylesterase-6-like [Microplitis mediator]